MADDRLDKAINTMAREAIYILAIDRISDSWNLWPEIGEDDWLAIDAEATRIIEELDPSLDEFQSAHAYLKSRAEGETP